MNKFLQAEELNRFLQEEEMNRLPKEENNNQYINKHQMGNVNTIKKNNNSKYNEYNFLNNTNNNYKNYSDLSNKNNENISYIENTTTAPRELIDSSPFNRNLYLYNEKPISQVTKCQKCPDMSKYIRKDKIPCWGCNLD